jgi:tetratricopeptide (TPR) repeat protein
MMDIRFHPSGMPKLSAMLLLSCLLLGLCADNVSSGAAEDAAAAAAAAEARRRYEESVRNACAGMEGTINVAEGQRDYVTDVARNTKEVSPKVKGAWDAMSDVYMNIETANGAVDTARALINPNANLNNAQYLVQDSRKDMFSVAGMLNMSVKELFGFVPPPNWNGAMPGEKPAATLDPKGITPSNTPGAGWTFGTFPPFQAGGGTGGQTPGTGQAPGGKKGGMEGGPALPNTVALTEGGGPAGGLPKPEGGSISIGRPAAPGQFQSKGEDPEDLGYGRPIGVRGASGRVRSAQGEAGRTFEERPRGGEKGGGSPAGLKDAPESWQTAEAWKFNTAGDYRAAERAAKAALLVDPKDSGAYEALAWAQLRQGKYRDAEGSASRALAINSRSARAYRIRAFARQMLGARAGMLSDIEMEARLNPDYADEALIARRGGDIYDPTRGDDELLNPRRRGRSPFKTALFVLLSLSAAGAGVFFALSRRKKSRRSPIGARHPAAPSPSAPAPAKPSSYTLEKELAGTRGNVFLAKDKTLDRMAIIRKLRVPDPEQRKLALAAARRAAAFSHPSSVRIYEVAEEGEWVSITSEHIAGPTISSLVADGKRLGLDRSVKILAAVCRTLEAAHAGGVLHAHLHLGNIFLSESGEVKVADFGTAGPGAVPEQDVEALGRCLSDLAGASGEAVPPRLLDLFSRSVCGTEPAVRSAGEFLKLLKE